MVTVSLAALLLPPCRLAEFTRVVPLLNPSVAIISFNTANWNPSCAQSFVAVAALTMVLGRTMLKLSFSSSVCAICCSKDFIMRVEEFASFV